MNLLLRNTFIPILNVGARGLTLIGRFVLTIYISKYIGLEAMGAYGLLAGALAIAPAVMGLGLNYYVNRDIVGEPLDIALRQARDRLTVSMIMAIAAALIFMAGQELGWTGAKLPLVIIAIIIIGECLAFDIHFTLISLGHPIAANTVMFLRTSLWVFPVAAMGIFFPQWRTMNGIWFGWLAGIAIYFAYLAVMIRKWPLKSFKQAPLDAERLKITISRGKLVYFNDICLVGLMFTDRFIINHFLGLHEAGEYVYFMSFGYAIYTLCFTSISQIYVPQMVLAAKNNNMTAWSGILRKSCLLSGGCSLIASALVFSLLWVLHDRFSMTGGTGLFVIFPLICVFVTVKVISDTLNFGIYSIGWDKALSYIIIAGFILNTGFMTVGILMYGMTGLVVGLILATALITAARGVVLSRHVADRKAV